MYPRLHPPSLLPKSNSQRGNWSSCFCCPENRWVPNCAGALVGCQCLAGRWGFLPPTPPDCAILSGNPPNQLFSCPPVPLSALEGQARELRCQGIRTSLSLLHQATAGKGKRQQSRLAPRAQRMRLVYFDFIIFVLQTCGLSCIGRTDAWQFVST